MEQKSRTGQYPVTVQESLLAAAEESAIIEAPACLPNFSTAQGAERRRRRSLDQISALGIEAFIELARMRPYAEGVSPNAPDPGAVIRSAVIHRQAWMLLTSGTDEPTLDQVLRYQHRRRCAGRLGDPSVPRQRSP